MNSETSKEQLISPEFFSWDRQIHLCKIDTNLSELDKRRLVRAFNYLRKEFGEKFLEEQYNLDVEPDKKHFLVMILILKKFPVALFQKAYSDWIIWFAKAVRKIKKINKNEALIKDLKRKDKHYSALIELIFAYKAVQSSFQTELFPNVSGKKPEFRLTNEKTSEHFDVEVTGLTIRDGIIGLAASIIRLFFVIFEHQYEILYSFDIFSQTISEVKMKEICEEIKDTITKVNEEMSFITKKYPDLLEFAIAHKTRKKEMNAWLKKTNNELNAIEFKKSFAEPEYYSIAKRIDNKMKGNLENSDNCIVIINSASIFYVLDVNKQEDFEKMKTIIEQAMFDYPKLSAIVVSSREFKPFVKEDKISEHYALIIDEKDPNNEGYIIIWNKHAENPMSKRNKRKLIHMLKK